MHYLAEAGLGLLMLMYALNTSEVALYTWGVRLSNLCPLINLKHHLKTDVEGLERWLRG